MKQEKTQVEQVFIVKQDIWGRIGIEHGVEIEKWEILMENTTREKNEMMKRQISGCDDGMTKRTKYKL